MSERGERVRKPAVFYGYKTVERVLADVFKVGESNISILKARINGFQRIGLTPDKPGRGKIISYSVYDIYDWALALAISSFGVPPKIVSRDFRMGTFRNFAEQIDEKRAQDDREYHLFLIYWPSLFYDEKEYTRKTIRYITEWYSPIGFRMRLTQFGNCLALVDLSAIKDAVDAALPAQADA